MLGDEEHYTSPRPSKQYPQLVDQILQILDTSWGPVTRHGDEFYARCIRPENHKHAGDPRHLSFNRVKGVAHCHSCQSSWNLRAFAEELDIPLDSSTNPKKNIEATYDYTDEKGVLLYQVVRYSPKEFRQRRPDPGKRGAWLWNMANVRLTLYRLPEVLDAIAKEKTIFICEGEKDCETLRSLGLAATTNPGGAGKWRHQFSQCLGGATLSIIADKDPSGREHALLVARSLSGRAASIRILELPGDHVKDVTDWVMAGGTVERLEALLSEAPEYQESESRIVAEREPLRFDAAQLPADDTRGGYCLWDGRLGMVRTVGRGSETKEMLVPLCNFIARVKEDVVKDDGVDPQHFFKIEGTLCSGRKLAELLVPANAFAAMNWVAQWGVAAILAAGQSRKDHLREAIQLFSNGAGRRTCYTHTGWVKIDGTWKFLGSEEPGVDVELEGLLTRYRLPAASDSPAEALKTSLELLNLGPTEITLPLLGATYLAPLGEALPSDFVVVAQGRTGAMKTSLVSVFLSHFGGPFAADQVYLNFEATENSLERIVSAAKDVMVLVDDFIPRASEADARVQERLFSRLVRAQSGHAARTRMRADTSLRPSYVPRGVVVVTAEIEPTGESTRARYLCLKMKRNDIRLEKLSKAQNQGGLLATAMRSYVDYLAPRLDELKRELPAEYRQLRTLFRQGMEHPKIPAMLAQIAAGCDLMLRCAVELAAITQDAADDMLVSAVDTLLRLGISQSDGIIGERPSQRLLRILRTLFAQKSVYLEGRNRREPWDPVRWGWVESTVLNPQGEDETRYLTKRNAEHVGWVEDDQSMVYLMSEATFRIVQRFAREQGSPFTMKRSSLYQDMSHERILELHEGREVFQKRFGSRNIHVIKIESGLL